MIAADTSTWIAYLEGDAGADAELLDRALADRQLVMPHAVLSELLSDPELPEDVVQLLLEVPLLEARQGYWERAGRLRARVLARRRKARLGDALIAQICIDHATPLITRDRDFQGFAASAALDLAVPG